MDEEIDLDALDKRIETVLGRALERHLTPVVQRLDSLEAPGASRSRLGEPHNILSLEGMRVATGLLQQQLAMLCTGASPAGSTTTGM